MLHQPQQDNLVTVAVVFAEPPTLQHAPPQATPQRRGGPGAPLHFGGIAGLCGGLAQALQLDLLHDQVAAGGALLSLLLHHARHILLSVRVPATPPAHRHALLHPKPSQGCSNLLVMGHKEARGGQGSDAAAETGGTLYVSAWRRLVRAVSTSRRVSSCTPSLVHWFCQLSYSSSVTELLEAMLRGKVRSLRPRATLIHLLVRAPAGPKAYGLWNRRPASLGNRHATKPQLARAHHEPSPTRITSSRGHVMRAAH